MPSNSYWLQGRAQRFDQLRGETRADVTIVGGGIAGLTAAYLLSCAGVEVAVLEARTIGSGATGHTTAHLTSQHGLVWDTRIRRFGFDAAKRIAMANEGAIGLVAGIAREEGIDCDLQIVESHIFTDDYKLEKTIEQEAEAASRLGIMADVVSRSKFLLPYAVALRFQRQAMFHPFKYINGLADAALRGNARIYEQSRVLHIEDGLVRTADGSVRARCIVVATHIPVINFPGWYFSRLYQNRSYAVAVRGAPPLAGMWNSADTGGYTYRTHGDMLVISGGDHRCGTETGIDHYASLQRHITAMFPQAQAEHFWSAQDAMTLDGLPYVGRYSAKSNNLFVATGFGKWGMTQGSLAGMILSDMILDKHHEYTDIYSPQRTVLPITVGEAARQNAVTAWHLMSGMVKLKNPRCAHMKCKLEWNADDQTWDCPCHGSRFDPEGNVLETPSIHGIEQPGMDNSTRNG